MWRWFIKDKQGNVAVWQRPNAPLWVGLISTVLAKIVPEGTFGNLFELVAFGALFTWAWLELFNGASYFRRLLGLIVLVALINAKL